MSARGGSHALPCLWKWDAGTSTGKWWYCCRRESGDAGRWRRLTVSLLEPVVSFLGRLSRSSLADSAPELMGTDNAFAQAPPKGLLHRWPRVPLGSPVAPWNKREQLQCFIQSVLAVPLLAA